MSRPVFASLALALLFMFVSPSLAAGDPAKGKALFAQCGACHKLAENAPPGIGPNLAKIVGRPVASIKGFKYSPAMVAYKGKWTPERLDAYLAAPMKTIPGNRMPYAGMRNPADRENLIAYLSAPSK